MEIKIKRIENGKLPEYKTEGSVGADCYARIAGRLLLGPGETYTIPLGFAVEIPKGYEMQIRPRSGLASKNKINVILGTIDSDYRGEVGAIFWNCGDKDFEINDGDRIAQAVITPVIKAEWHLTDKLSETERGKGGFGSTGVSENKEIEMSYPHKVEKFYEPFREISDVEKLIGKEVEVNGTKGKVIAVFHIGIRKVVQFTLLRDNLCCGDSCQMDLIQAFERVRIDGHRFGKEIEFEG